MIIALKIGHSYQGGAFELREESFGCQLTYRSIRLCVCIFGFLLVLSVLSVSPMLNIVTLYLMPFTYLLANLNNYYNTMEIQ